MLVQLPGVYVDIAALERQLEAIGATRSRAVEVLAIDIVVRPVAGALKALAIVSEGIFTAQVHADLIERQPVCSVTIFDPVLGVHLILEIDAA
jgi:hypothetical protein